MRRIDKKRGLGVQTLLLVTAILVLPGGVCAHETTGGGHDLFPVFESIKPAVEFWKKVYTQYSTSQGILHDKDHVEVIYEIIDLVPPEKPGSRKINKKRVDSAKKKYRAILQALARGEEPQNRTGEVVAALFGKNTKPEEYRRAAGSIRFQLGQKDRFRKGLIRSGAFLEQIKAIFREQGLPEALAYLPHVESSFNYKAYSKFGAAGIWQFTHGTGRRYLKIDYTLDERRDPIRSTHAAARHLRDNYEKLGSWPLAITAYNHGANGMARAIQEVNGNFEAIFNHYDGRRFGFASRNFYAEFLAAKEIADNVSLYFGELELEPPIRAVDVVMPGYADMEETADHFGLDRKVLADLNPALRKPVHNGQKYIPKGYRLRLPEDKVTAAKGSTIEIPSSLLKSKQKPSRFYRVQPGDVAGRIARIHHVTLQDLIFANGLNARATIYAGQNLRIPVPGEKLMLAAVDRGAVGRAGGGMKNEVSAAKTPDALPAEKKTGEGIPGEVEKSPEDGGGDLAAVPVPARINPVVVSGNLLVEKEYDDKGKTIGIIRVEVEETLGHYADWLQIPTWRIRRLNGFRYGRPIHFHQSIKIPFGPVDRKTFEEKRYEYHKEMEEDFFSAYGVVGVRSYRVIRGDSIWKLCQESFELPFWLIRKYNPAQNFDKLMAGQTINVPVVEKIDRENRDDGGNATD